MNELIQYQRQPSIKSQPRTAEGNKRKIPLRSILKSSQSSPRFTQSQNLFQSSQFYSTQNSSTFIQSKNNKSAEKRIPKLILNQLNTHQEDFFLTEYHKPVEVKRKSILKDAPKIYFKKQQQIDVVVSDLKRAVSQLKNIQQIIDGQDRKSMYSKHSTQEDFDQIQVTETVSGKTETFFPKADTVDRMFLVQQIERQVSEKKIGIQSHQVSPQSSRRKSRQTFHFSRDNSLIKQVSNQTKSTKFMDEIVVKKQLYNSRQDQIQKIQDVLKFGQTKMNNIPPTFKEKQNKLLGLQLQLKQLMDQQKIVEESHQNIDSEYSQLKQQIQEFEEKVDEQETIKLSLRNMIEVRARDCIIKKVPFENEEIMLFVLKNFLSSEEELLGNDVKALDKIKQEFLRLKREKYLTKMKQNLLEENNRIKENNDQQVQQQILAEIQLKQEIEIEKQMQEQKKVEKQYNKQVKFQIKIDSQIEKIKEYKSFFEEIQNNFQQINKPSDILDQFHHVKQIFYPSLKNRYNNKQIKIPRKSNQFLNKRLQILQNKIKNLRNELDKMQQDYNKTKIQAYAETTLDTQKDQEDIFLQQKKQSEDSISKEKQKIKQFQFQQEDTIESQFIKIFECQRVLQAKLQNEYVSDEDILTFKQQRQFALQLNKQSNPQQNNDDSGFFNRFKINQQHDTEFPYY